jgi:hypothetical protein
MKNIHLIPTGKPSRLHKFGDCFDTNAHLQKWHNGAKPEYYNIYITNDEEIKVGDWICDIELNRIEQCLYSGTFRNWKKITLTTDQDLIKDGVQAIDDEFLEWFVKNPSCEFADVNDWMDTNGNIAFGGNTRYQLCNHLYNKQIIPNEELKETLEEAAEKYADFSNDYVPMSFGDKFNETTKRDFIKGAKWQQERMYSEEDMAESFMACWKANVPEGFECKLSFKEWFEQFKKEIR